MSQRLTRENLEVVAPKWRVGAHRQTERIFRLETPSSGDSVNPLS
jgi:hypothetical protein